MLHLGRANAEGKRAKGTVGAGVRVAPNHGHTRQSGALLRAHLTNDALARVTQVELGGTELPAVGRQLTHLHP